MAPASTASTVTPTRKKAGDLRAAERHPERQREARKTRGNPYVMTLVTVVTLRPPTLQMVATAGDLGRCARDDLSEA